jgi:hypothetical protein
LHLTILSDSFRPATIAGCERFFVLQFVIAVAMLVWGAAVAPLQSVYMSR